MVSFFVDEKEKNGLIPAIRFASIQIAEEKKELWIMAVQSPHSRKLAAIAVHFQKEARKAHEEYVAHVALVPESIVPHTFLYLIEEAIFFQLDAKYYHDIALFNLFSVLYSKPRHSLGYTEFSFYTRGPQLYIYPNGAQEYF
jgi:hypothetical protein